MPLIIPSNSISDGGYVVDNSLRFNDGSSDYLNRTPSSAGNRKTFTLSFWIKRGVLSSQDHIAYASGYTEIRFTSGDNTMFRNAGGNFGLSDAVFRDVSAWYHIVYAIDTTQATESNRIKLYVNGEQSTVTTFPTLNFDFAWNNNVEHQIGASGGAEFFDGYMAEFVNIDGQQLDATSFGEFDEDSGIWKPIDVSGLTFGTNGFYLDFENSGSLGADVSGNGNNFTVNNLTAIDQTTDTPTNNFATLNPLVVIGNTGQTYADGNLTFNASGANWTATNSTIGASQGKWYAEFKVVTLSSSTGYGMVGVTGTENITNGNFISTEANSVGLGLDYRGGANVAVYSGGSYVQAAGADFAAGAIVGIAVDMDNKKLYFSHNGTYLTVGGSVGDPTSGATGTGAFTIPSGIETFLFAVGGYSTSFKGTCNFGNAPYTISSGNTDGNGYGNFEYAVPSGYLSLCTKNLSEVLG